ncbi:MAG: response regulator, partial [Firmicutes bacterium]|nr:response regulator [Bacillota bacterium]
MEGATIVVVEDDEQLATLLCARLEHYGYRVVRALAYEDVRAQVLAAHPHLVVLDINLPRYDGFHWCRKIRLDSQVPILFLSGRSGPMDQVLALEGGGDDYVGVAEQTLRTCEVTLARCRPTILPGWPFSHV